MIEKFLISIGMIVFGISLASYAKQKEFLDKGVVTKGKIIEIKEKPPTLQPKSPYLYYSPIIEFTHNGQTFTFESTKSSSDCPYTVGEEVNVRYLKRKPKIAEIEGVELETDIPKKNQLQLMFTALAIIIISIIHLQ